MLNVDGIAAVKPYNDPCSNGVKVYVTVTYAACPEALVSACEHVLSLLHVVALPCVSTIFVLSVRFCDLSKVDEDVIWVCVDVNGVLVPRWNAKFCAAADAALATIMEFANSQPYCAIPSAVMIRTGETRASSTATAPLWRFCFMTLFRE